jgi:hypothetical protein
MKEKIILEFDVQEVQTILEGLANMPYKYVKDLIEKITLETNKQINDGND